MTGSNQLLKDQEKNEILKGLIIESATAKNAFNQVENKMLAIKENIERNKKMIKALKQENIELEEQSNNATISELGEIDFSQFDDYATNIAVNERKIKAIEATVNKFENELELLLLTQYENNLQKCNNLTQKAFEYLGDNLLAEFLSDEAIKQKISAIFTALRYSEIHITAGRMIDEPKKVIANLFAEKMQENFSYNPSLDQQFSYPEPKFKRPDYGIFGRQAKIAELKEVLNK